MNEEQIDHAHIERRVQDWLSRINGLYDFVKSNLEKHRNILCKSTKTMSMHEELMEKYRVPSVEVPILDIYKNDELIASFKPMGLWVIGANGRIDILTKNGAFILVDIAEKFNAPIWNAYSPSNRKKAISFDTNFITNMVESYENL